MPQVVRRLCIKAKVDKRAPVRDAADVFVSSTSSPTWRDDDDDDDAARDDAARRFESAPLFDSARDAAPLFGSGDARHTSRLIDSSREGTLFVNTSREGTLFDAGGGASPLFESGVDLYRAARLFDSGRRNDAQLFGDAFDGGGDEQNDEQNVYTIRLGDVAPPRFVLKSPRSDASSPRNALELSPWEAHV
ncbi:hypothetical protein M885DRAFT_505336 [Pelagophyceae sp. CCMP2097]|nr:hypothetical protein M885DRAFT_505336 [Pelagophyceae sp. CCMP2097]